MNWIVYTYDGDGVCHAYGSFNSTAGDKAGEPFDQAAAEALAANINSFMDTTAIRAMALPVEQATQPGV